MVTKIFGYVIAIIGIVGIAAWVLPEVRTAIQFIPEEFADMPLLIASLALTAIGLLFALKSGGGRGGSRKGMEVPIYQGKNVVGYRRH